MPRAYEIFPKNRRRILGNLKVNTSLIIVNVVLFIIFSILISINQDYLKYIALEPSNIIQGKYIWTFLTSMFMHAGFLHLFVNMLSLFFVGSLIERILGPKRYLKFYLAAGLFAGIFFVLVEWIINGFGFPAGYSLFAVGASGALFGLIGLLMLLTPNLPVYIMFIPIPIKIKYAAPGMLLALWAISIAGDVPIGNTAHLGGLILGLAFGLYLRKKYKNKTKRISKYFS